jgi:hypothetical protein
MYSRNGINKTRRHISKETTNLEKKRGIKIEIINA